MENKKETSYKTYSVMDFLSFTKCSQSFLVCENKLSVDKVQEKSDEGKGYRVLKRYHLDDRNLAYFSDGYLREEKDGRYEKLLFSTFSSAPEIFTARYKGKRTVFVYFNGRLYSTGFYLDVLKIPDGYSYEEYKGGLYFISGKSVIFCEDFFKSKNVKIFGFLQPEEDEGKPIKICRIGTAIFVFYEYGIYKIESPFDNEKVKLIRVCGEDKISAVFDSENQVYFMSKQTLKTFDGKEVKSIAKTPDCDVIESVYVDGFKCAFAVQKRGKKYLLVYKNELFAPYFIKVDEDDEFSLHNFEVGDYACWESLQTNLGVRGEKFIRAIEVKTNDECDITLNFDGRERNYHVYKRHVNLGVIAENVSVKISTCGKPITITNLQFSYKKGE